jgi:hypothetical protein
LLTANRIKEKPGLCKAAIIVFILLEALVLAQTWFAYEDNFLTVAQMQHRGIHHGLPFAWHFAMWSDLLLVSPLAAYIVDRYGPAWRFPHVVLSLVLAIATSALLHWTYTWSPSPEAHMQDHRLTKAGMVHAAYMAAAFAIFMQFFLFTPHVTRKPLAAISFLLVLHVLIGTHMALGILALYVPQAWYPGQPLKSLAGWATLAGLAGALAWRNYREIDWDALEALPTRHTLGKKAIIVFEYWTLHRFDTTERYLKALDYLASYVGVSAFTSVFVAKVQISTAFNGGIFRWENWVTFVENTALPCFLIVLFGSIYFLGRHSVRLELAIGNKLFPPDRIPTDWGTSKVRVVALFSVVMHLLLFLSLTWFADNIKIASAIMFVTACNDWRTRYLIEGGISRYLSDEKYAPKPGEKDYAAILERREVARDFLFSKPHLRKETLRAAGCGLALAIALYGYATETDQFDYIAYLVLIVTLISNEFITVRWRVRMFLDMKAIDDRAKGRATPPAQT